MRRVGGRCDLQEQHLGVQGPHTLVVLLCEVLQPCVLLICTLPHHAACRWRQAEKMGTMSVPCTSTTPPTTAQSWDHIAMQSMASGGTKPYLAIPSIPHHAVCQLRLMRRWARCPSHEPVWSQRAHRRQPGPESCMQGRQWPRQ